MKIQNKIPAAICLSLLLICTGSALAYRSHKAQSKGEAPVDNGTLVQAEDNPILDKAKKAEIEDSRSPIGCKDMGYRFDMKVLHLKSDSVEAKQSLFLVYNTSNQDIGLFQMLGEESARSMFLNHKINTKQWAVLSTSLKKLHYICTIVDSKRTYGKIVNCADVIKVCQYNNVRFGLNNQGNYWLVNSNSRNGAVNAVVHYGIIPGI